MNVKVNSTVLQNSGSFQLEYKASSILYAVKRRLLDDITSDKWIYVSCLH